MFCIDARQTKKALFSHRSEKKFASISLRSENERRTLVWSRKSANTLIYQSVIYYPFFIHAVMSCLSNKQLSPATVVISQHSQLGLGSLDIQYHGLIILHAAVAWTRREHAVKSSAGDLRLHLRTSSRCKNHVIQAAMLACGSTRYTDFWFAPSLYMYSHCSGRLIRLQSLNLLLWKLNTGGNT